jgi:hypothetical protein
MKMTILYHTADENSRAVEEFADNCKSMSDKEINLVNIDTPEGDSLAALYDVMSYPAVLLIREDGQLNKGWQGSQLPATSEAIGYLSN